ncbi:hypothetical protein BD408DRAFT_75100 [Parasitella parasitica]|nr:hypothetical protein BD408DRAFT_75100 [Parasitella parasitica]
MDSFFAFLYLFIPFFDFLHVFRVCAIRFPIMYFLASSYYSFSNYSTFFSLLWKELTHS